MATTRRQHPSVRFQNGEVKDFFTAMEVYAAQYREELRIGRELVRENPNPEPGKDARELEEQSEGVMHIELMISEAKLIYHQEVGEAIKRAAAKMRENGDQHLRHIADALESGNWSQLAL